jgi:hypothetical protein
VIESLIFNMIQVWGELHKVGERRGRRNWRGRVN